MKKRTHLICGVPRRIISALCVGVLMAGAFSSENVAHAQIDKDQDAERLFREGQKLMEERRFGEACPKFDAAYKKDQQLGTLLNLAYCHKEQGAVWQAWLEFKDAEMKAIELKRTDRKDFARQKMAELEKQKELTRVVIEPQTRVELVEVSIEDRRIPEAEKGVPFAVEPGPRKVTFSAKGKKLKHTIVTIVKGDKPQRVPVPEMETETTVTLASPPDNNPPEPAKAKPAPPAAAAADTHRDDNDTTIVAPYKTIMYVGFAVGVPAAIVGAVTGIMSLSSDCNTRTGSCATDEQYSSKSTVAAISTITVAVAVAGIGTGLGIYFFAPRGKSKAATVGHGSLGQGRPQGLHLSPEIGLGWVGLHGVY